MPDIESTTCRSCLPSLLLLVACFPATEQGWDADSGTIAFTEGASQSDNTSADEELGEVPHQEFPFDPDDLAIRPDVQSLAESQDRCCPIVNGEQEDELCGHDYLNTCPSDWGYHTGGGITGWAVVFCLVCATPDCDPYVNQNTGWIDQGTWGWECRGLAFKMNGGDLPEYGPLVEDNCSDDECTGATGTMQTSLPSPNSCGVGNHRQTGEMYGSNGAMCCAQENGEYACVPAGGHGESANDHCSLSNYSTQPSTYDAQYGDNLAYCAQCSGDVGWNIIAPPNYITQQDKWRYAEGCFNVAGTKSTHYACDGLLIKSNGDLLEDNCD